MAFQFSIDLMLVFILVGFQLSGKSSHGHRLRTEENIPMLETGHAVYHELRRQKLEVTHENTSRVINELLTKDPIAFTRNILEDEKSLYQNEKVLLLNGVKSPAEVAYVKKRFGEKNVFLIAFHASQQTRFGRVQNPDRFNVSGRYHEKTQEDKDLAIWENFLSRDLREVGLGLCKLISLSNNVIITENKLWPFYDFDKSYYYFKEVIMSKLTTDR